MVVLITPSIYHLVAPSVLWIKFTQKLPTLRLFLGPVHGRVTAPKSSLCGTYRKQAKTVINLSTARLRCQLLVYWVQLCQFSTWPTQGKNSTSTLLIRKERDSISVATLSPPEWFLRKDAQRWEPCQWFINCESQSHRTVSTDHKCRKERRPEVNSSRGSSAYQPNALPLGQTGSLNGWTNVILAYIHIRVGNHCYSLSITLSHLVTLVLYRLLPLYSTALCDATRQTLRKQGHGNFFYHYSIQD